MSLQNGFFCCSSPSLENEPNCQAFDKIQRNILKQVLWQVIPFNPNVTFPFASTIRFDIWAAIPIEQFVLSQQGQVEEWLSGNAVLSFDNSERFSIHIPNVGPLGDLSVVFTLFMHPGKTGICSSFQLQLISSLWFQAGLFSTVQISEYANWSAPAFQECTHSSMSSDVIILQDLKSFDGFEFASCLNGLHAEQLRRAWIFTCNDIKTLINYFYGSLSLVPEEEKGDRCLKTLKGERPLSSSYHMTRVSVQARGTVSIGWLLSLNSFLKCVKYTSTTDILSVFIKILEKSLLMDDHRALPIIRLSIASRCHPFFLRC